MSPKAEDNPSEEGGDLEDEIGVNYFKTQLIVLCLYTISTASPQGHALPMLQFVHRGVWLGEGGFPLELG